MIAGLMAEAEYRIGDWVIYNRFLSRVAGVRRFRGRFTYEIEWAGGRISGLPDGALSLAFVDHPV